MSQQDLDRAYGRAPSSGSPEQHSVHTRSRSTAHAQSPKRLSVLSGRSRSNTTNSATSSRRSPGSSMTSVEGPSLPAYEDRAGSSAGFRYDRSESVTKSLLSRGSRILRRRGSKFHIVSTLDEEDEVEREKSRFEVSELFSRHHKPRPSDAHDQLKSLISDPFDFHHLTHTSPSQFQSLEKARETDLVTEFSAIRASQRPVTNLKGIQAQDLHFRDFSSEDFTQGGIAIAENDVSPDPAPISPPASPNGSISISPKQRDIRGRRESRVVENFSRPVPRFPKDPGVANSPPRASSPRLASSPELPEPAPRAIDEILGLSSQPTYPEHVFSQDGDDDDDVYRSAPWSQLQAQDMFPVPAAHAVTTDAESERLGVRTSSMSLTALSSDLEGVPEEEEGEEEADATLELEAAPELPIDHEPPQPDTGFHPLPLVDPQSASAAAPITSDLSVYVARDLARKFSEALGSPTLPQDCSTAGASVPEPPSSGCAGLRSSAAPQAVYETIYDSWDADIDYCYEHAAESNSNFDWTRNSVDEPRADVTTETTAPSENDAMVSCDRLCAIAVSTTNLDSIPYSEVSSQVAVTPSTTGYETGMAAYQRDSDYFRPVRFGPALNKSLNPESIYDDYLATDAESDRHFSFYSQQGAIQPIEHSISPRSSFSPISKCNSQESLILSRAASIVRKHRSSVSTASVPELVHSLANGRELIPTEQMLSGEYTAVGRPDSSHHKQIKSLARELEAQMLCRTESDAGCEPLSPGSVIPSSIHDRAKSTSEVEAAPLAAAAASRVAPRRKGRASYSLFPAAAN
ncbi:uncharacterized protein BO97DRAFT_350313 [Aspergillus homomorphus CBS 101889]|uniref:CRIB domain-containing protein n=1 Tax=Aspergillus homomorphus (strain CBS 101889) TaxID=1450537 RepID=A0A395HQ82_ASPHC|nr:hypothetical protein BO97DRAFT_350313 [Aspergillus homomorphus CBS 101889]RAL10112.1 hypothetical protein BO97DRAFT_350313 [Aspergillus homomorphus CBS 101889]